MSLNINSLQDDYKSLKSAEGGSFLENFVKMPEGKGSVIMRLLPPAAKGMFGQDENPFYLITAIHRVNGKSLHDIRDYVSGKWVGRNPICEYMRQLWKDSEQSAPEEAAKKQALYRNIKPVERYYYNVIVREERAEDGLVKKNVGPKILSVGKTVHEIILRGILGDKEMNQPRLGDVTDSKKGCDFKLVKTIRKSGDQSFPNYEGSHFLEESTAGNLDEWEKWLKNLHNLNVLRHTKTYEELEHELLIHLGLKQENSDGFDATKYKASEKTAISEEKQQVTATKSRVLVPNSDDSDGADEEFLQELRGLSE